MRGIPGRIQGHILQHLSVALLTIHNCSQRMHDPAFCNSSRGIGVPTSLKIYNRYKNNYVEHQEIEQSRVKSLKDCYEYQSRFPYLNVIFCV